MKEIDGLYAYGVYIEPMLLADGSWRWVVSDFAFEASAEMALYGGADEA